MTLQPFDQLVLSCVGLGNLLFLNASVQGLTVSIPIVHFQHRDLRFGCDVDMRHLLVGDQVLPQPLPCPMVASLGIIVRPTNPTPSSSAVLGSGTGFG